MPYIQDPQRRFMLKRQSQAADPGELNYEITTLLLSYHNSRPTYYGICIIMGTLICAAFEFYRRVAAPYEDRKCAENGDVYE